MRVLWLFLAVTSFLMPIVAQAEDAKAPADPVQAVFDRLGKMALPEQQAWLKRLEDRAGRAALLTLQPDEATLQQKKIRSQLHKKMVTWEVLREVIEDTNAREKDAIDRLAQRYRTLVDKTFDKQPEVLAKRQQAWLDVDNEWKLAGSPFDRQDRLIDWLEAGIEDAAKPQEAKEPEAPQEEPQIAEKSESEEESDKDTKDIAEATLPPEAETPLPPPTPAVTLPEQNPVTAEVPMERPDEDERQPSTEAPSSPPTAVARKSMPTTKNPASDIEKPPLPHRKIAPTNKLPPKVDEDLPQETADIDLPTETRVQPPSMIESPSQTAVSLDEELPPDSVEIKVDELAVRIGGCNMAFRALEMELDEKGEWTATRLDLLLERLETLAIRRSDLSLFREIVPEEKRALLDPLPPLKGVVSQMATRIVEARAFVSGSNFKGTDSERQTELKRLEELSRRLAKLTEE